MEKNINMLYKEYYNECLYIMLNYNKIKNNPYTKVNSLTKTLFIKELIVIALMVIFTIIFLFTKYIPVVILITFLFLVLCENLYTHLLAVKRIKDEIGKKSVNKVQVKKDNIVLSEERKDSKNKKVKIEKGSTKWENIIYIIFNKNTICYLPKDNANNIICTSINDKEKVLKDINKYNRQDLLIDNTGLYI